MQFHFDDGPASQILNVRAALGAPSAGTHLYICGPAGYINHVLQSAQGMGWPAEQIHLEYFSAAPQDKTGDGSFQVKIASSGTVYDVPADQSVTQALQKHGIDILTSCEQGVCGTCITRVLEGECDHRDMYFTDEERAKNDQFTPCCSRAKSALLVLDL